MNQKEIFKDIIGYEGLYQVSNIGRVKSLKRIGKGRGLNIGFAERIFNEKILKPQLTNKYYSVMLSKNGKIKLMKIHRLVLTAFKENKENKSQVNHIDGNKLNNNIENLEWCTVSENITHSYKIGLRSKKGEKHHLCKLKLIDVIKIKLLQPMSRNDELKLSKKLGVHFDTIRAIKYERSWAHVKVSFQGC